MTREETLKRLKTRASHWLHAWEHWVQVEADPNSDAYLARVSARQGDLVHCLQLSSNSTAEEIRQGFADLLLTIDMCAGGVPQRPTPRSGT